MPPASATSRLAAAAAPGFVLERSEAVPALIGRHQDFLFIAGLGGPVLEAMGVICLRIEQPRDVIPTTSAALTMVFKGGQAVAVLLSQRLIGAKPF